MTSTGPLWASELHSPLWMEPSADLKLRVILVTTRAALRHADGDAAQSRAIVARGRALLETLASEGDRPDPPALEAARAELDGLIDT
jgi:hypothetical protein